MHWAARLLGPPGDPSQQTPEPRVAAGMAHTSLVNLFLAFMLSAEDRLE